MIVKYKIVITVSLIYTLLEWTNFYSVFTVTRWQNNYIKFTIKYENTKKISIMFFVLL